MDNFAGILTKKGTDIVADSVADGTPANVSTFVIGDGNGNVPVVDASQTSLVNEVYRGPLNSFSRDSKNPGVITAEAVVPADAGPFWMREFGIVTDDGTLFAVTALPPQYKISGNTGSTAEMTVTMKIVVSEQANVTLIVDANTVMATKAYVDNAVDGATADLATKEYVGESISSAMEGMATEEFVNSAVDAVVPDYDTASGVEHIPADIDGTRSKRIVQKGAVTITSKPSGAIKVIFKEPFPTTCEHISLTCFNPGLAIDSASWQVGYTLQANLATLPTKTDFSFYLLRDEDPNSFPTFSPNGTVFWTAEGY